MSDIYGMPRRSILAEGWFWLLAILLTVAVLAVGGLGWRYVIAGPKGAVEAREQILSGATRIAAYNHFFDLCAAVQSYEGALAASMMELETAAPNDQARIRTNITGLTAQRTRAIAQYNADARKDYTIGQFRSLALPFQLSAAPYVKGVTTPCVP